MPNKIFLVQGYRIAHYGAALLSIIQAILNIVIGVSSLAIAPEHMKLNKDMFTQVVYAGNVIGIVFFFLEGVADIFMQHHAFTYMLAKALALGLSLIAVLALLVSLGSLQLKTSFRKRALTWLSLLIADAVGLYFGILHSQHVRMPEKYLTVLCGMLVLFSTLLNKHLQLIHRYEKAMPADVEAQG